MEQTRIHQLKEIYRRSLLDDVIPFWLRHGLDHQYGGFLTSLDRDGAVYDTDKSVWFQGRGTWMFAELYNTVERRPEWLEAARLGYDFLTRHCFDSDGRMFFSVTREGRPLRKRRYVFSESFAVIACAEYAQATGSEAALNQAKETYRLMLHYLKTPGLLPPKTIPETRQSKAHAIPMILIATTQELRQADSDPFYQTVIDESLHEILNHFVRRDERAVLETVGPNGERLDSAEGRRINPGHAIESAWFVLREALYRQDQSLIPPALNMLNWSLERGWDREYGGMLYFVDAEGKPPINLEWDMKLWWPHTEALYALLLAHHLTGDAAYADWFEKVHDWTFAHFPDPEHGEWYGYLHRDGSVANPAKGSLWKGPFHIPRGLLLCMQILDQMVGKR